MVLLEKDLNILCDGVEMGRITQGNTIKYIKMAISSNFGNTFSILAASAWLPYSPMTSKQILTLNLLYDLSQVRTLILLVVVPCCVLQSDVPYCSCSVPTYSCIAHSDTQYAHPVTACSCFKL